jgi:excisionase family DNA binding protein
MADPDKSEAARNDDGRWKQWYTVREAAEYLGVSQPTIFRWMRDGLLSFFKVGGATRFSQEGLDAVIEKTTGLKEAQSVAGRCVACGHGVLVEGRLQGAGKLYFRPSKSSFWVLSEAMVPTKARVCTACGYLQTYVDAEKLKRLKATSIEDSGLEPDVSTEGDTTE